MSYCHFGDAAMRLRLMPGPNTGTTITGLNPAISRLLRSGHEAVRSADRSIFGRPLRYQQVQHKSAGGAGQAQTCRSCRRETDKSRSPPRHGRRGGEGGRRGPASCPRRYCGCGASLYLSARSSRITSAIGTVGSATAYGRAADDPPRRHPDLGPPWRWSSWLAVAHTARPRPTWQDARCAAGGRLSQVVRWRTVLLSGRRMSSGAGRDRSRFAIAQERSPSAMPDLIARQPARLGPIRACFSTTCRRCPSGCWRLFSF